MLEQFEFENKRDRIEAEIDAVRFDHRRPAKMRPDSLFRCGNLVAIDLHVRLWVEEPLIIMEENVRARRRLSIWA
jgi:hypothetical protein